VSEAIKTILTDERKWRRFSNHGIIAAKKYYSWNSHTNIYTGWLQETLEPKTRKPKELKISESRADRLRNARNLLITDIDGTLIASEDSFPGLEELKVFLNQNRNDFCFGVASGRSYALIQDVLSKIDIEVDVVVCAVGARIYYDMEGEALDTDGMDYLRFKWNPDLIRDKLESIHWLVPQEDEAQDIYKISYYYDPMDFDEEILKNTLDKDFYQITMVNSHQRYLDILPVHASKGNAIRY